MLQYNNMVKNGEVRETDILQNDMVMFYTTNGRGNQRTYPTHVAPDEPHCFLDMI